MTSQAEIKRQLPFHLQQFVAEQNYASRYNHQDQALWRFVMAELTKQLKSSAHTVYFEGLERTGISLEAIPSIDEMNECLARMGWRAIVVDGFIPPQAFMELQSLKVLAIALDMRSIHNIEYTPAPDIIHEAAGHAPIIADVEYSDYLQRFGEVGMKAVYNQYDLDLYEAARQLSIAKETAAQSQVATAQQTLDDLANSPGAPSELALLTRLHWWTVEYGLVGTTTDYAIFGAGLLSSLSESLICLDDSQVTKLPLTIDAINTPYDITTLQPQLFVTKSCRHLTQILDEYAKTMCYRTGGSPSLETAIEAGVVTTSQLSSGLQVSGRFSALLKNAIGEPIYLRTDGPTQLAFEHTELDGHGIKHHGSGFGSPIGRLCNLMKPLEDASEYELQEMQIQRGEWTQLDFISGVTVKGVLSTILKSGGRLLLMSFQNCTVLSPEGEVLFEPSWGSYDMAIGDEVISVFSGSADPVHFDVYPKASKSTTRTNQSLPEAINQLYEAFNNADQAAIGELSEQALLSAPQEWLLLTGLQKRLPPDSPLRISIDQQLDQIKLQNPNLASLIDRALAV